MIYVTTSNSYAHLLPIFEYLYKKYWNDPEIMVVGYDKPSNFDLPFHSMGVQGSVSEWSTDLRKFFSEQEHEHFVWIMEDTLLRQPVNEDAIIRAWFLTTNPKIGRIDLTNDIHKRPHRTDSLGFTFAGADTRYRLSTQPSIWNREFLLQYLADGLTPWAFETQDPFNDGWHICGFKHPAVLSNEGVRKHDRFALDLNGLPQEDIDYIKSIATWLK